VGPVLGVLVNTLTVVIGASAGLLLRRGLPEKLTKAVMAAIGLCTLYIGISGALEGGNAIVLILSMVLGTGVGTALDIDGAIARLGGAIERRFPQRGEKASVAQGFMTASLLFCVGAMTVVGSLNAGLSGDNKLLYTKSVLDLFSSCMLAGTLGVGVLCSAAFVLVFQGALVLLSGALRFLLTDAALLGEVTCAGSVMIIGLGLNLLDVTKLKVADMLPAVVFVPLVYYGVRLLPI